MLGHDHPTAFDGSRSKPFALRFTNPHPCEERKDGAASVVVAQKLSRIKTPALSLQSAERQGRGNLGI